MWHVAKSPEIYFDTLTTTRFTPTLLSNVQIKFPNLVWSKTVYLKNKTAPCNTQQTNTYHCHFYITSLLRGVSFSSVSLLVSIEQSHIVIPKHWTSLSSVLHPGSRLLYFLFPISSKFYLSLFTAVLGKAWSCGRKSKKNQSIINYWYSKGGHLPARILLVKFIFPLKLPLI